MVCSGEAAAQGGMKSYTLTVQMSGTYNGQPLGSATFLVPITEDSTDPLSDLVITGVLPPPTAVFPSVVIDDLTWAKMNTPYSAYLAGLDCLDDTCPNICSCILCPDCKDNGVSPDGIDEVFSIAFSNGDRMQGISDINNLTKTVVYQVSANLQTPVAGGDGEGGVLFSETAEFSFPATASSDDPVRASGTIASGPLAAIFDGLVMLKTEGAVWPNNLTMTKSLVFQTDLSFELRFDFAPGTDACSADIDDDNEVGILDFLLLIANWGPCP
ncbi:MAG: hypothetical protein ACYS15_10560 [Planctomycetota bacterium]|jgi:hypothetical protein